MPCSVAQFRVSNHYVNPNNFPESERLLRPVSDEITTRDLVISYVTQLAFDALRIAFACAQTYLDPAFSFKTIVPDFFNGLVNYQVFFMGICAGLYQEKSYPDSLADYQQSLRRYRIGVTNSHLPFPKPLPPALLKDLKDHYSMLAAYSSAGYQTYVLNKLVNNSCVAIGYGMAAFFINRYASEIAHFPFPVRLGFNIIRLFVSSGSPAMMLGSSIPNYLGINAYIHRNKFFKFFPD